MAGFALLELSIALLVGTLLAVWGTAALMRRVDDAGAQAMGVWLLEVRQATARMLERHFEALAAGAAPRDGQGRALYADPTAPTLAEFRAQGLLPEGFPDASTGGVQARVRLLRTQPCPGDTCRLDALVYTSQPLRTSNGEPDLMRMAVLSGAAGGYAGYAMAGQGGRLRGPAFDFPNPYAAGVAALPAGTPVLWAGMDLATADRYVRRHDTRDPLLETSLTATGGITAGGAIQAAAGVSSGGRLKTAEFLELGGTVTAGRACPSSALVARLDQGGLATCRNGVWTGEDGGFGGAYADNNRYGCAQYGGQSTVNPRTGKCSCPAGYRKVIVSAGGKWNDVEGWTTGYVCVR